MHARKGASCDLAIFTYMYLQEFRRIEVKGFDASLFHTNQVFYSSKDGTKIPMFVVHRKVLPLHNCYIITTMSCVRIHVYV